MKISKFFDSKALLPAGLSLFMVVFSQTARWMLGYAPYWVVLVVPAMVFLALRLCLPGGKHAAKSLDSADHEPHRSGFPRVLFIVAVNAAIAARIVGIVWGSGYLSLVFEAQYITGNAHIDTLFHSAIANMLAFFGKPSIGVEGIVGLKYHFGANWLIGNIGRLLGMDALAAYHLLYPALIHPLLLGLFLILAEDIRSFFAEKADSRLVEAAAFLTFFIAIAGCIPDPVRLSTASWNGILVSESYAVSIALLYFHAFVLLRLRVFEVKGARFVLAVSAVFAGAAGLTLTKISVGSLWVAGFGCLWLAHPKNLNSLGIAISAFFGWILMVPLVHYSNGVQGLAFFHFLRKYVDPHFLAWLPITHYGWTLAAIAMLMYLLRSGRLDPEKSRSAVMLIGGAALAGFLPGLFLRIPGGSAYYFSDVNAWVSLPFVTVLVVALHDRIFKAGKTAIGTNWTMLVSAVLFAAVLGTSILNSMGSFSRFVKQTRSYVHAKENLQARFLWNALHGLSRMQESQRAVLYELVPPYGNIGAGNPRTWMISLLSASALAGMPTLNEAEPYLGKIVDGAVGYGFDDLLKIDHGGGSDGLKVLRIPKFRDQ